VSLEVSSASLVASSALLAASLASLAVYSASSALLAVYSVLLAASLALLAVSSASLAVSLASLAAPSVLLVQAPDFTEDDITGLSNRVCLVNPKTMVMSVVTYQAKVDGGHRTIIELRV
jgi:hypothetical protein